MSADADNRLPADALRSLRRYARRNAVVEHCGLCNAGLAEDHAHLVELASRRLVCACDACAILFNDQGAGNYRRVPRRSWMLDAFRLSDAAWQELGLPINLAFLLPSATAGRVVAFYPSPAGATEALVAPNAWQTLAEDNPVLRELEPDLEALLINRLGPAVEYYRVGIDECYKLVGLVRTHWRGLSGGTVVWRELGHFFTALKARSQPRAAANGDLSHA
jgi:hypothetical protein